MLYRFLCGEDRTKHVDIELTMELILGDLFQRYELVDAGIVHQHVKSTEGLFGFVKHSPHVRGFGDIALYRNGFTTFRFDVGDNAVCVLLAGGIVDHHCGACRAQALGDRRADALRCAGHDRCLALQIAHLDPPNAMPPPPHFLRSIIAEI